MSESSFKIVKARPPQVESVAELFDLYRVFYEQESNIDLATAFVAERLNKGDSVIFLALDNANSEALGFTQLYPSFSSTAAKPIWILNDLYTHADARGRGIGTALIEEARRLAKETGAIRVDLATAQDNVTAQRVYHALGFERDETFYHYSLNV